GWLVTSGRYAEADSPAFYRAHEGLPIRTQNHRLTTRRYRCRASVRVDAGAVRRAGRRSLQARQDRGTLLVQQGLLGERWFRSGFPGRPELGAAETSGVLSGVHRA